MVLSNMVACFLKQQADLGTWPHLNPSDYIALVTVCACCMRPCLRTISWPLAVFRATQG